MALANKTLRKATALTGAPIQGYFLAARVHPLLAMAPTLVLFLAFLSQNLILQLLTTVIVVLALFLSLGRSIAVTGSEIVVMQGRPPLWRPARIVTRLPRQRIPVARTRLYWKFTLDGQRFWVNKTFTDQVNLISEQALEGAKTAPGQGTTSQSAKSSRASQPARERQVVDSTKRITPKGSRNRKPKKYR